MSRHPSPVTRHPSPVTRRASLDQPSVLWAFLATIIFGFLCDAVASRTALAATRAYNGVAPAIYVEYVSLTANETVIYETDSLSNNADPVMHLLRVETDGSYTAIDYSDDIAWPSNPNSRITFTNGVTPLRYAIVIRAYSTSNLGICNVRKNGVLRRVGAPVGGWLASSSLFTFGAGDLAHTVHNPGGSVTELLMKFNSNPYWPTATAIGNGIAGSAEMQVSGTESQFLVGTPQINEPAGYTSAREGPCRIMFNDVATDVDGDGLGSGLEQALGTCSTTAGCQFDYVGKDTDRDGLYDGEEIFGVAGTLPDGSDDLDFARWGGNPLKKDMFVEVDWLSTFGPPLATPADSPFQWIRDNPTSTIGGWTGTLEAWVDAVRAPYLAAPAAQIHNPDGTAGINAHFDVGVPPLNVQDEVKFGNWPTGSVRVLVPDFKMQFTGPATGNVTLTLGTASTFFDATGKTPTEIAAAVAALGLGMGQSVILKTFDPNAAGGPLVVFATSVPGKHFNRGISATPGAVVVLIESDADLRNRYNVTPTQVDAVRRGRMRYGIVSVPNSAGSAYGPAWVGGLNHSTFIHEFGHTAGLQHWGHKAWGQEGIDCVPHYPSLMRYKATDTGFSSDEQGLLFNTAHLTEWQPWGPDYTYSKFSSFPFTYAAPTGPNGVDWNRDGQLSSSQQWRGAALVLAAGSCQGFAQGKTVIDPAVDVRGGVDLVHYGSKLYALWANGTEIRVKSATLGAAGNKSCTGSPDPEGPTQCLTWSATTNLVANDTTFGVSAAVFNGALFVATKNSSGQIIVRQYVLDSNGLLALVGAPAVLTTGTSEGAIDGTPELVIRHQAVQGNKFGVLYRSRVGDFRSYGWNGSQWSYEGFLPDFTTGNPIVGSQPPAAKDWPDASVAGFAANEHRTVAILPGANGFVRVYVLDYATNTWRDTGMFIGFAATAAKPFLEYRTVRTGTGVPDTNFTGHFMIGWMTPGLLQPIAYTNTSTLVSRSQPPSASAPGALSVLNADDFLQNQWAYSQAGTATALYSDGTIDGVFGLSPVAIPNDANGLLFYPHADGAPDHTYTVYSDFRVMEDYLCANLGPSRGYTCATNKPYPYSASQTFNVFD